VLVPGNVQLPEVSPDGRHVALVADQGSEHAALRVARMADGTFTKFKVPLPRWTPGDTIDVGRCRWFPDGRSLAFIGRDPDGVYGISVQEFRPEADTSATRRWLVPPDPEYAAESLAISPDGSHVTVAYWDQLFSLMVAENVPGIRRPRRAAIQ
jgi:Tol biopolymer transport system component